MKSKKRYFAFLVLLLSLPLYYCAGIPITKVPQPTPGLVLIINQNEWAKGEVLIFNSHINKDNLFDVNIDGSIILKNPPIIRIKIPCAPGANIASISYVVLNPDQSYSLVYFWETSFGNFINFSYDFVRTTRNSFNDHYKDFFGREIWADRVIYAPRVDHMKAQPYRLRIIGPKQ